MLTEESQTQKTSILLPLYEATESDSESEENASFQGAEMGVNNLMGGFSFLR